MEQTTDSHQRGERERDWSTEAKEIKEHIFTTGEHRQQCGDCQREGEAGWRGARGENWDSCNSINNNI